MNGRFLLVIGSFLAGLACPPPAPGQEPLPEFRRIPDAAGLSHSSVYSIHRDSRGFLWVGTVDGLNRYDGYEFRVFRHNQADSTSIAGNLVWDLLEDTSGSLWVATDGGLDRFDPSNEQFRHFPVGAADPSQPSAWTRLLEDREGAVWAGTPQGLFRLEPSTGQFNEVHLSWGVESSSVIAIALDPAGDVWVTTVHSDGTRLIRVGGVGALEPVGGTMTEALRFTSNGDAWLSPTGPARPDPERGTVDGADPNTRVFAIEEASDGTLWFATSVGLQRRAPSGALVTVPLEPDDQAYLFEYARSLHLDRSGLVWVGTQGGLYVYDPNAKRFATFSGDPGDPRSIPTRAFSSIWMDTDSTLWVGTFGQGLYRVDVAGDATRIDRPAAGLASDVTWTLQRSVVDGGLYVGTNYGLHVVDEQVGRLRAVEFPESPPRPWSAQGIAEAPDGWLWVAGFGAVFGFDPRSRQTHRIEFGDGATGLSSTTNWAITVDRGGIVWVGAGRSGLDRIDPATGDVTHIDLTTDVGTSLSGEGIWHLLEGADGKLWIATGSGLGRLDPVTLQFSLFGETSGLPGSIVYAIAEDAVGHLWLATNRGLANFDPLRPEEGFRAYDRADGVGSTEFNRHAVFAAPDGELLFGGMDGLTRFRPEQIRENPVAPYTVVTRVESSGDDGLLTHEPESGSVRLPHDQNTVSFEFSALSFTNPAQNRYRFRLNGVDGDWVDAGTRRFARYPSLRAGDYTFEVVGSNNDGLWGETPAIYRVSIAPAIWATAWARALAFLAMALSLYGLYRYRLRRLLELERLRFRIAGDLHDDLSSNLSAVALMSELVSESDQLAEPDRQRLEKIRTTARGMVEDVRDLVWIVDPGHDSLADFEAKIKDVAATLLGQLDYEVTAELGETERVLPMDVRRHVYLICKEALHNVARHAAASRVRLHMTATPDALRCEITDDGRGFDPRESSPGAGLRSLRRRAEAIGGSVVVAPVEGGGTSVLLIVPL